MSMAGTASDIATDVGREKFTVCVKSIQECSSDDLRAWSSLAETSSPFTVFQRPDFVRAIGEGEVLFLREGGRMRLVLPFTLKQSHGARILSMTGTPVCQYDNLLADDNAARDGLIGVLLDRLKGRGVDALRLERIPANSPWFSHKAFASRQTNLLEAPFRHFGGMDGPLSTGYSSSKRLMRKKRKLAETGNVDYRAEPAGTACPEMIDHAISMKQAWLKEKGETSRLFARAELCAQFRAMFLRPESSGWIFSVTKDGVPIAVHLAFCTPLSLHQHFTVYDPSYHVFSPSALLTHFQMEWCIERQMKIFDFMPPAYDYKMDWCDQKMAVHDVFLPLTLKGWMSLDHAKLRAKPLLRKVFYRLPENLRKQIVNAMNG